MNHTGPSDLTTTSLGEFGRLPWSWGGQDGAAAVDLGARDAAGEVLAADQPPFPIDSVTVGEIGGVLEDQN